MRRTLSCVHQVRYSAVSSDSARRCIERPVSQDSRWRPPRPLRRCHSVGAAVTAAAEAAAAALLPSHLCTGPGAEGWKEVEGAMRARKGSVSVHMLSDVDDEVSAAALSTAAFRRWEAASAAFPASLPVMEANLRRSAS